MLKEIMTERECSELRSLIDTAETIVLWQGTVDGYSRPIS